MAESVQSGSAEPAMDDAGSAHESAEAMGDLDALGAEDALDTEPVESAMADLGSEDVCATEPIESAMADSGAEDACIAEPADDKDVADGKMLMDEYTYFAAGGAGAEGDEAAAKDSDMGGDTDSCIAETLCDHGTPSTDQKRQVDNQLGLVPTPDLWLTSTLNYFLWPTIYL